jgi:hypothetical protein
VSERAFWTALTIALAAGLVLVVVAFLVHPGETLGACG